MKSMIAFTLAFGLAAAGVTSAGMQGQGADPEGKKKPEYEEKNPGGYRDSQTTGTQGSGAAAKEKAVSSDKSDSASPTRGKESDKHGEGSSGEKSY